MPDLGVVPPQYVRAHCMILRPLAVSRFLSFMFSVRPFFMDWQFSSSGQEVISLYLFCKVSAIFARYKREREADSTLKVFLRQGTFLKGESILTRLMYVIH